MVLCLFFVFVVAATKWEMTWSDEFNGQSLGANWNVKQNQSHCCGPLGEPEWELYLKEQVSVADGYLQIKTQHKQNVGPKHGGGTEVYNYTSGWVDTKNNFSQKFGRFAANCSLPPNSASGVWPAFWLMPQDDLCWPTGGEIDVFEMVGNPFDLLSLTYGSYHWAPAGQCNKDKEPIPGMGFRPLNATKDWQMSWHVYAVEWFEDRLDFYVDDTKYLTRLASQVTLPPGPMYVIFDTAVNSWLFPPKASTRAYDGDGVALKVDWVRAYKAV
mmetsp:Transcript_46955/g.92435  ORF Transcript_46955/g.92435 Transcript_46955/m.92435 type:complete len:271 (-) Transcript_46955:63-875(-)